jgi:hypothetical protein
MPATTAEGASGSHRFDQTIDRAELMELAAVQFLLSWSFYSGAMWTFRRTHGDTQQN